MTFKKWIQVFSPLIIFTSVMMLSRFDYHPIAFAIVASIVLGVSIINFMSYIERPKTADEKKKNIMLYVSFGLTVMIAVAFFLSTW